MTIVPLKTIESQEPMATRTLPRLVLAAAIAGASVMLAVVAT